MSGPSPADRGRSSPDPQRSLGRDRKRLGQVFSGVPLGRLLAALAGAGDARSVLDPMAGIGDMLVGCMPMGTGAARLWGIEIDQRLVEVAAGRLAQGEGSIVCGNAFDPVTWGPLPDAYDLVITNPPYVRYQLAGLDSVVGGVPDASAVRRGLLACIASSKHLSDADRSLLSDCAACYSGQADLAVPAWLLCMARVKAGGTLALVLPDTWLSREYARPVLRALDRLFRVRCVVQDGDASWFPDALVRTVLLVADRIEGSGHPAPLRGHVSARLTSDLATPTSLVARGFPGPSPEGGFARWVGGVRDTKRTRRRGRAVARWSTGDDLRAAAGGQSTALGAPYSLAIPERLGKGLRPKGSPLLTLDELGWAVGQGLRTGANDFFYVSGDAATGYRSPLLGERQLLLPDDVVRPVLRRQTDLPTPMREVARTSTTVILLDGWAREVDASSSEGPKPWRLIDGDLADLIAVAETTTFAREGRTLALPSLAAVRTNVRAGNEARGIVARFWYQLPPLAPRHTPRIAVARVNGAWAVPYAISEGMVVDANFSTLWPVRSDALDADMLLALLTSSWAKAYLELTATVLGGGALKVEAVHLRRLRLPRAEPGVSDELRRLGAVLRAGSADPALSTRIDAIVEALVGYDVSRRTTEVLARGLLGDRARG